MTTLTPLRPGTTVPTSTATLTAAVYCRISDDRNGDELGVARQEHDCRELCARRNITDVRVYTDDDRSAYSGKLRPAYERMLRDIENGSVQMLVAWHPDRLHRSTVELERFIPIVEAANISIDTVKAGTFDLATPTGRMVARILGATARGESEHKSDRIKRKMIELAESGAMTSGTRAFAYGPATKLVDAKVRNLASTERKQKRKQLIAERGADFWKIDRRTIVDDEADIIREVAARILNHEALRNVCRDLTARGVSTVQGNPWTPTVLRRMLRASRISGRREHFGVVTAVGQWPAIISVEDSEALRRLLSDPKRRSGTWTFRSYPLRQVVRCGLCGKSLRANPVKGRRTYVCRTGPPFDGCGHIKVDADSLEADVFERIKVAVNSPEFGKMLTAGDDAAASAALSEVAALDAERMKLATAFSARQFEQDEWQVIRTELVARRDAAQRRYDSLRGHDALQRIARPLRNSWSALDDAARREVIRLVVSEVRIVSAVRGRPRYDPDRVTVLWRV